MRIVDDVLEITSPEAERLLRERLLFGRGGAFHEMFRRELGLRVTGKQVDAIIKWIADMLET